MRRGLFLPKGRHQIEANSQVANIFLVCAAKALHSLPTASKFPKSSRRIPWHVSVSGRRSIIASIIGISVLKEGVHMVENIGCWLDRPGLHRIDVPPERHILGQALD